MFLNPTNTVYDAKRLVGRKFSERDVQDDIANMNWPFSIRKAGGDKPTIRGLISSEHRSEHNCNQCQPPWTPSPSPCPPFAVLPLIKQACGCVVLEEDAGIYESALAHHARA